MWTARATVPNYRIPKPPLTCTSTPSARQPVKEVINGVITGVDAYSELSRQSTKVVRMTDPFSPCGAVAFEFPVSYSPSTSGIRIPSQKSGEQPRVILTTRIRQTRLGFVTGRMPTYRDTTTFTDPVTTCSRALWVSSPWSILLSGVASHALPSTQHPWPVERGVVDHHID
jgi:hypothetical protein